MFILTPTTYLGFCIFYIFCTALPRIVDMFLMYRDVKGNISCLMNFSFYMYSLSCIILA